jgi:hypothetical protein
MQCMNCRAADTECEKGIFLYLYRYGEVGERSELLIGANVKLENLLWCCIF